MIPNIRELVTNPEASKHTRAIRKVTSGELLTKQATTEKKLFYTKNTYIPKVLLDVVTAEIEAYIGE
jgi:hypothetical protein